MQVVPRVTPLVLPGEGVSDTCCRKEGIMLDINLIREQPDSVRKSLADRQDDPSVVDQILNLDTEWRSVLAQTETLKAERNTVSREIGRMKDPATSADTNVPSPWRTSRRPMRLRLLTASRSTVRLTPSVAASSRSDGSLSPGLSRSVAMRDLICSTTPSDSLTLGILPARCIDNTSFGNTWGGMRIIPSYSDHILHSFLNPSIGIGRFHWYAEG